jgi:hypothetical protein
MSNALKTKMFKTLVCITVLIWLVNIGSFAQEKPKTEKSESIECEATGVSAQMGKIVSVKIRINEYSTAEDKQILLEAYEKKGNEGVVNALSKMPSKGRLSISGTLGFDINFIREFPSENERMIRIIANRPISIGETWTDNRSADFKLSALELHLSNEKGKSTGTLFPACGFAIDKENKEVTIQNYKNPWKLVSFILWDKDNK